MNLIRIKTSIYLLLMIQDKYIIWGIIVLILLFALYKNNNLFYKKNLLVFDQMKYNLFYLIKVLNINLIYFILKFSYKIFC